MREVSRRGVLGTVAAAAGGLGLSSADLLGASAATPETAGRTLLAFTVHATALRAHGAIRARALGEQYLLTGSLTHAARTGFSAGADAGEFVAHVTVTGRHDLVTGGARTLESQVFDLTDGSLTGVGTISADGTGRFAVTGGTGAFHAARGSYTVHRDPGLFTGGSATFTFTLTSREDNPRGR